MVISNLTYDERRRLHKACMCPICKTPIEDYESFEKVVVNYKRYKLYTFFHTSCIVSLHEPIEEANEDEQT